MKISKLPTIWLKPNFGNSAIVFKQRQIFKLGRWRLYEVSVGSRHVKMLLDHEVRDRYSNMHRLTDNFFIGLEKYER